MNRRIATAVGLLAALGTLEWPVMTAGASAIQKGKPGAGFATFATLPNLGHGSEAFAVDDTGTVIAGFVRDSDDRMFPARWTLDGQSWSLTTLPLPPGINCAWGRDVNQYGDVAGVQEPKRAPNALLWPANGGVAVLGCDPDSSSMRMWGVEGISAFGQVVVGSVAYFEIIDGVQKLTRVAGSVWTPGTCREELPPLNPNGGSGAFAVNGYATVVGGNSGGVPVRWTKAGDTWAIEPLDARRGNVWSSNAAGDLAGHVSVPCEVANGCVRAATWSIGVGTRLIGTLGGSWSSAHDINSSGEVVGTSATSRGDGTAYFWSESAGMRQLPFESRWAVAWAVSDVRLDGTRVVVGTSARYEAMVWIVREP